MLSDIGHITLMKSVHGMNAVCITQEANNGHYDKATPASTEARCLSYKSFLQGWLVLGASVRAAKMLDGVIAISRFKLATVL